MSTSDQLPGVLINPAMSQAGLHAPSSIVTINYHEELLAHNAERVQRGIPILVARGPLMEAAQDQARWMAYTSTLSHIRPSGSDPWQRIIDWGTEHTWASENAAWGFTSVKDVLAGWMSSAGHRANILSSDATHVGFGYAPPSWWATAFARPR